MIESKRINIIIVALMAAAVIFTSIVVIIPKNLSSSSSPTTGAQMEYTSRIFNKDNVTEINIDMKQEDWDFIIGNATQEEYRSANITIDGEAFNNVGIRPKGNSSLRSVASSTSTDRYSFKVDFDTYVEGQNCFGLDKLVLNNMMSDATYMKEYLSYDLFAKMGIVTPVYSYANININGKPWGLYLMVESGEESFLQRNFGSDHGKLYKPEGTGSNLKWVSENASSYSGIRSNAAVKVTDSDFDRVIEMIKNLDSGTQIEKYIDVDETLRYFAVNTILVNLDSYASNLKHNYYLYEKDGYFSILPWDLNMSFAGFQAGGAQQSVDFSIDTPFTDSAANSPLISKLLEVPEYKELYRKYLDETVKLYFDSKVFSNSVDKLDNLINSYVKNDATAFYTYEQYQKSLPVLKEFGKLRAASVTAQLAGNTTVGTVSLDMSALGSMGGGGGGMGGGMPGGQNQGAQNNAQGGNGGNLPANGQGAPRGGDMGGGMMQPNANRDLGGGKQGNVPGGQGGFPGGDMGRGQNNMQANPQSLIIYGAIAGVSALFMAAGIIFALKFKRRRYIKGRL